MAAGCLTTVPPFAGPSWQPAQAGQNPTALTIWPVLMVANSTSAFHTIGLPYTLRQPHFRLGAFIQLWTISPPAKKQPAQKSTTFSVLSLRMQLRTFGI
jgi:hypothetical protein